MGYPRLLALKKPIELFDPSRSIYPNPSSTNITNSNITNSDGSFKYLIKLA
jgi:hypothetical protein